MSSIHLAHLGIEPRNSQIPLGLARFDSLPDSALIDVRIVSAVLGQSVSSTWRAVKAGRLVKPVKSGPAMTRWTVGAIRRHLAAVGGEAQ